MTGFAAPLNIAGKDVVLDALPPPAELAVDVAVGDGEKLVAEVVAGIGGGVGIFAGLEYSVAFAGVVTFVVVFKNPIIYMLISHHSPFAKHTEAPIQS